MVVNAMLDIDQQKEQSAHPIATTKQTENRLLKVRTHGLNGKHFKPDHLDVFSLHDTIGGKYDPIKSFDRFLRKGNNKKKSCQVMAVHAILTRHPSKRIRYLTILPRGHPAGYDALRDALISVQKASGLPEIFVYVEQNETELAIENYCKNISDFEHSTLVLDERMPFQHFAKIVELGLAKGFGELVVICTGDWEKNVNNYLYLLNLSPESKKKLHFAGIPLSINKYSQANFNIASVLIASGFKSVSFRDPEIHPAIQKKIGIRPRKTSTQKLQDARWIELTKLDYATLHPMACGCLEGKRPDVIGVDYCVIHHDLENLAAAFLKLQNSKDAINTLAKVPSVLPILQKLRIVP